MNEEDPEEPKGKRELHLQESLRVGPDRVHRIGFAGDHIEGRRRSQHYTPTTTDLFDTLGFEIQTVAAVLADPHAPEITSMPYPDVLVQDRAPQVDPEAG